MFIGSLVLFFAAVVIILKTSVPVFNKVFGTNLAPPKEVEYSYNNILIWVAIIIGLLTAVTQYLKYKETSSKFFIKKNSNTHYYQHSCVSTYTCFWEY